MAEKILTPIFLFFFGLALIWVVFYGFAVMFQQQAVFAAWTKRNLKKLFTWLWEHHAKFVVGFFVGVGATIAHLHYVCHLI